MRRALLALALLSPLGCYHVRYLSGAPPTPIPNEARWHHDFVYFAELEHVNLLRECPTGFSAVDHQVGPLQALSVIGGSVLLSWAAGLGALVGVVWQPSEVRVTCAAAVMPPPPALPPPPDVPTQ